MRSPDSAVVNAQEEVLLFHTSSVQSEDIAAWKTLARESLEPNPFFEPEFVLPLARARLVDDVHLLVIRKAGRWIFCMPVVKRFGWRKIPVPVLATWISQYTFLGTPLLADKDVRPLVDMIERVQKAYSSLIVFEWISASGDVCALLTKALTLCGGSVVHWEDFERAAICQASTNCVEISGKQRSNLGRKRRAIERECGGVLRLIDRSADPAAIDEFLALEASGWKGAEGTAIASRATDAVFFYEACRAFAAAGQLQILALGGPRTVAMQCNFLSGGVLFGFRTCYDEAMARFSPGALLLLDVIASFDTSGATWLDSCTSPDNELCNRLMPERQKIRTIIVGSADLIGVALGATMKTAAVLRRARGSIKQNRWPSIVYRWLQLPRSLQTIDH